MTEYTIELNEATTAILVDLSAYYGEDPTRVIEYLVRKSTRQELISISEQRSFLPSYSPLSRNKLKTFNTNNNILLKEILKEISKESNPKVTGKKEKRKKPVTDIPGMWMGDRDRETITDIRLIDYAEKSGFDWYATREMFIDFVDHHVSKGNKWANWYSTWQRWVRNQVKFHGAPTKKPDSVLKSYEQFDPSKELR